MTAYMVIIAEVTDGEQFMKYAKEAGKLVGEFGGLYVVRGKDSKVLEGIWPDEQKTVISQWPSIEAALAFWNSPQYARIKKLRLGTAKVRVKLFEGC